MCLFHIDMMFLLHREYVSSAQKITLFSRANMCLIHTKHVSVIPTKYVGSTEWSWDQEVAGSIPGARR